MPYPFDENSGFQRYLKLFTGFFDMNVSNNVAYTQNTVIQTVRTCINTVQFMGNIRLKAGVSFAANTLLGTLPSDIRPQTTIFVPGGIYEGNTGEYRGTFLRITTGGEVRTTEQINAGLANTVYVYLNGSSYNISRNYYGGSN